MIAVRPCLSPAVLPRTRVPAAGIAAGAKVPWFSELCKLCNVIQAKG